MCLSSRSAPLATALSQASWWSREDLFRSCPAATTCCRGGSGMISRLRRREAADLGLGRHVEDPRLWHDRPDLRLKKPRWRWCFPSSGNDGGLSLLIPASVSAALVVGDGRLCRYVQASPCKVSRAVVFARCLLVVSERNFYNLYLQ
jgi:hypothetical protein